MGPCKRETPPPTESPTEIRITQRPTTNSPTYSISGEPSSNPSVIPSEIHTTKPSFGVTELPSGAPHVSTARPSRPPTGAPAYEKYAQVPSRSPETDAPTSQPTSRATSRPTSKPARDSPAPSLQPSPHGSVATNVTIPSTLTNVTFGHSSERARVTLWASVASAGVSIAVVLALRKSGHSLSCQNRRLIRLDDDVSSDDVATDDFASLPVTVDCFGQPIKKSPAPPLVPPTKMVSHELRPPVPSDIVYNSTSWSDEENPKEHRDAVLSVNDLLKSYSSTVEDSFSPKVKDLAVEVSLSQNQGMTMFPSALDKRSCSRYGDGRNVCTPSSMECFAGTQRIRVKRTVVAPSGKLGIIIRQSTEGCKVSPTDDASNRSLKKIYILRFLPLIDRYTMSRHIL